MSRPLRTPKQRAIMTEILKAADDGEFLMLEELQSRLKPEYAEYNALRCSIQLLVRNKILSRKRIGSRSLLMPTVEAYQWFRAGV